MNKSWECNQKRDAILFVDAYYCVLNKSRESDGNFVEARQAIKKAAHKHRNTHSLPIHQQYPGRNYKEKERPHSQRQQRKHTILYNKRAILIPRKLQNFTGGHKRRLE